MDFLKQNYKKLLTLIVMVAFIFGAYFLLTPNQGSVISEVAQANRAETQRTVNMLNDLQDIKIDTTIFEDPTFTSLRDEESNLPEYEIGKVNPFEPLPTSTRRTLSDDELPQESDEDEVIEIVL